MRVHDGIYLLIFIPPYFALFYSILFYPWLDGLMCLNPCEGGQSSLIAHCILRFKLNVPITTRRMNAALRNRIFSFIFLYS